MYIQIYIALSTILPDNGVGRCWKGFWLRRRQLPTSREICAQTPWTETPQSRSTWFKCKMTVFQTVIKLFLFHKILLECSFICDLSRRVTSWRWGSWGSWTSRLDRRLGASLIEVMENQKERDPTATPAVQYGEIGCFHLPSSNMFSFWKARK